MCSHPTPSYRILTPARPASVTSRGQPGTGPWQSILMGTRIKMKTLQPEIEWVKYGHIEVVSSNVLWCRTKASRQLASPLPLLHSGHVTKWHRAVNDDPRSFHKRSKLMVALVRSLSCLLWSLQSSVPISHPPTVFKCLFSIHTGHYTTSRRFVHSSTKYLCVLRDWADCSSGPGHSRLHPVNISTFGPINQMKLNSL